MQAKSIHIIGISGSLRPQSSNTFILKAIADMLPDSVQLNLYENLDTLPHFNPDIEKDGVPDSVQHLRSVIKQCDAVIICTPEYAFGVPGSLKNGLDWLVSSGELNDKPVAAISASPLLTGGDKALASLINTLTALGTKNSEPLCLSIPTISKRMNTNGMITDDKLRSELSEILNRLLSTIESKEKV